MIKNKMKLSGILAAILLTISACSDSGVQVVDNEVQPQEALAELDEQTETANQDDADQSASTLSNIVDTAIAAESFTTLVAALQATGLDETLADEANTFTVFAPTDDAFAKLGADTINALLGDTETLSDILLYHVVPNAAVDAETAISLSGSMVEMANGDNVAVVFDGEKLFINQSQVVMTDVLASNGIIHVIDTVLTPPVDTEQMQEEAPLNIVETAVAAGSFNVLAQALVATGLDEVLSNPEETFTVLAPTDEAFGKLPEGTLEALLADPEQLTNILLYHVIGGVAIDSTTALSFAGQSVTTANGQDVEVSLVDGQLFVNQAAVTTVDVVASNGIIHVIDSVLIPPTADSQEPADESEPVQEAPTGTILDIARSNDNFSTLVAAVEATGLDGALGHPGDTYTVFAPTNEAFAALGQATIDALLADPDILRNILLLHVVPGTVIDAETAMTLVGFDIQGGNGGTLRLALSDDGALTINGATLIATDIEAVNGVVHVIDAVLLP